MDRPTTGQPTDPPPTNLLWLPIAEAAARLGISENAVRNRLKRRTLRSRKGNDRRVFVRLDPTDPPTTNPAANHRPTHPTTAPACEPKSHGSPGGSKVPPLA